MIIDHRIQNQVEMRLEAKFVIILALFSTVELDFDAEDFHRRIYIVGNGGSKTICREG